MKYEAIIEKLEKIFYECDKHILRINSASSHLKDIFPLNMKSYSNLNEEEIRYIDQFLFRFSKLQDSMGQKLFKTMLLFLKEDIEGMPFIDVLNLMEKLHLLENAKIWQELRDDRNALAHNYEDEPEEMSESINKLFAKKDILVGIYENIKKQYDRF